MVSHSSIAGVSGLTLATDDDVRRAVELFANLDLLLTQTQHPSIERLKKEPSWGLLSSMSARAMEQQSACIALYSHGYYAPAEALCRTVLEASANLYFCSIGDSCKSVLSYFRSYIETERRQLNLWESSVKKGSQSETSSKEHLRRIADKHVALSGYEHVLKQVFLQIGLNYEQADKEWPSIYDRFKALRKELDYRTVYAALCSQAHNDAEDLLNDFVLGVSQVAGADEAQAFENKTFSFCMILATLAFLVEANFIWLAKYDLKIDDRHKHLLQGVLRFADEVSHRPYEGWSTRSENG